jgi:hypothetical protein
VNWDAIKNNFPKNLKISPLAVVPHKSCVYRMILDLSFQLLVNGNKIDSVNDSSDKSLAHQESMYELGNVIPCIIWTMALSKDKTTPFMFTKVDLDRIQAIRDSGYALRCFSVTKYTRQRWLLENGSKC